MSNESPHEALDEVLSKGDSHRAGAAHAPGPRSRLSAEGLTRKFGAFVAVDEFDVALPGGCCLTIFGPNGAGKTTLLKMLALLVRPTSGRIWVEGEDATRGPQRDALRTRMGLLSHQPLLYGHLSPMENLRFYGKLYGLSRILERSEQVLEGVGLADRANSPVRTFSRGMLQRAAIARVLLHDPDIIFLDEPFTGLDRSGARMLLDILSAQRDDGRTLILTTHDMLRGLELGNELIILHRARVRCALSRSQTDLQAFGELYEFHTQGRR